MRSNGTLVAVLLQSDYYLIVDVQHIPFRSRDTRRSPKYAINFRHKIRQTRPGSTSSPPPPNRTGCRAGSRAHHSPVAQR
jgi:hypothetical protein